MRGEGGTRAKRGRGRGFCFAKPGLAPAIELYQISGVSRPNIAANQHKAAGVDIAEADAGLNNIVARITATWPKSGFGAVQLPIGYFANVVDIGGIGLAITTDGVGSKEMVADQMRKYDTIGID